MARVSLQTELDVPAQQVWDVVGRFNALPDWHPAVEHSELENGGRVRRLRLLGGGTIVEQLDEMNDSDRVYSYSIVNSPLPVWDYRATIRVRPRPGGQGTVVEWTGSFEAEGAAEREAIAAIEDIYQAGLDNLQRIFNL